MSTKEKFPTHATSWYYTGLGQRVKPRTKIITKLVITLHFWFHTRVGAF